MLTIRAVSFKGRPLDRELSARFEEAGGTIGRGEINTLVLSDPERFISRTHATISFQAGGYLITDTGTKNPVVVNGRPLGSGSQARLNDGDQIKVGDYLLQVTLSASSAPLAASSSAAAAASSPFDPFADLLAPPDRSAVRAPVIPPASSRPAANAPLIPDYADPLAGIRAPEPSIDDLIGPKSSAPAELLPADFLSEKPATPPKGGGGGTLDDLLDLFPRKPTQPPSVPDHGQEIFTPYTPPAARPEATVKPEPPAVKPSAPPFMPQPGAAANSTGERRAVRFARAAATARLPAGRGHSGHPGQEPHARYDGGDRQASARSGAGHARSPARPRAHEERDAGRHDDDHGAGQQPAEVLADG